MVTVLKNRLTYSQRLFALLITFALILVVGFIGFQYEREKQFKHESLNARLQSVNLQIIDAIADGEAIEPCIDKQRIHYPDIRITLIDTMGNVLFDSPVEWAQEIIPNHKDRDEVIAALKYGSGYTIQRRSVYDNKPYFYSATSAGKMVVRTALPYNLSLARLLEADLSFLWVMLGLTFAICILGYFVTRRMGQSVRRLQKFATLASRNEPFEDVKDFPNDELGEISRNIVQLYAQLQQSISDRNREHAKVLHEEQENIRLKRQLTNNINHELKTPVSSIQGYLETIINNPDIQEETRQLFIEKSYAQAERLRQLLQDVSIITRMDEAAQLIEREHTDITAIVQDIITEKSLRPDSSQPRLHCNFTTALPIYGNEALLISIFRNLTENAISYSGGRDIYISLIEETEQEYTFTFADNGIGVEDEHLSRIFERFYRVDKGRSRKFGGTGLGLSIVKNAVLFHGGTIEARNRREGGLEFIFTLKKMGE